MSDQEMNIAIAEVVGWKDLEINYHSQLIGRFPEYGTIRYVPNYFGDLNAMHEAEKVLVEMGVNKWWTYAGHILRHNPSPFGAETAIHATARQRAEAFLRTLWKWKEGK